MTNFIFQLQAIAHYINLTLLEIIRHQLVWGFALGFAGSTLIHALVISDNPKHIPHILTKSQHRAFHHVSIPNEQGVHERSYTEFQKEYNRVRIVFFGALLTFLVVVAIALIRY